MAKKGGVIQINFDCSYLNPEVAKVLKSNQNSFLQEIEEIIGKSVLVKSDPLLHQTRFDLA